jgi:hypothetical protein
VPWLAPTIVMIRAALSVPGVSCHSTDTAPPRCPA